MELKIAICDDNQSDIDRLSGLLTTYSFQTETDYQITRFNDGRRLIDSLRKEPSFPFHLVFLDIEMPRENGIDLAREVNRIMPSATLLVFVSSYPEYMGESFSVHPFDFLQKPVTTEQILRLMGDVRAHFSNMQRQLLNVSKDGATVSIHAEEITYIQSLNAKLQDMIIYTTQESFLRRGTLSEMEKRFSNLLYPLNRSVLINILQVHYLTDDKVVLTDGTALHVSVRNRKKLLGILKSNPTIQL